MATLCRQQFNAESEHPPPVDRWVCSFSFRRGHSYPTAATVPLIRLLFELHRMPRSTTQKWYFHSFPEICFPNVFPFLKIRPYKHKENTVIFP